MFGCPSLVPPGLGGTGWALPATEPTKTSVQDTLFRADGALANGTLVISWGQSQLAHDAQNYFGIKAHAHHAQLLTRRSNA